MEVKKVARRLSLANDINTLSLEALGDKYLKSKATFEKFMKDYADFFCLDSIYQIRAMEHYNKIKELISYGYLMYPNDNNETYSSDILQVMSENLELYSRSNNKDYVGHAEFSFRIVTGAYRSKIEERYKEMVKGMDKAAQKYDVKSKSLDDFPVFLNMLKYSTNPDTFDHNLGVYMESHPLIKECKDIYFLYFANYVLSKGGEVDPVFIQDVKDVINVSKTFDKQIIHPINKNKNYSRVARYTLKNIERYEKKLEKEKLEEEDNPKSLEKSNN